MATATFTTVPAEPATLVGPKKTTASWKVLVVGAVVAVFVVAMCAAAAMTLSKTGSKTTIELNSMGYICHSGGTSWECPPRYPYCALSPMGSPKCSASALITPEQWPFIPLAQADDEQDDEQ